MHVTDPYGRPYAYDGEEIIIETRLTAEQHAGCYDAVGIPVPLYDPDQQSVSIEPPDPGHAERLRRYLREERIEHQCELSVTHKPDSPAMREIARLLELLRSAPGLPGALETAARLSPDTASAAEAVEALYGSVGADQTAAHIEDAQDREAGARELVALAERLDLDEDALDEAVHDSISAEASQINNGGWEAQIRHLISTNGVEVARALIEEAAK
jgi:hypothetical protein